MMAQWYNCPGCSRVIKYGASPCPHCKGMLDWRQQQPILYLPSDDTQQRFTPVTKDEHILGKIQLNKPSKSLSKKQKVALIYVPLSILVVLFGFSSVIAFNKSDDTPLPSNSNSATTKYSPPAYTAPKYTPPRIHHRPIMRLMMIYYPQCLRVAIIGTCQITTAILAHLHTNHLHIHRHSLIVMMT